MKPINKVQKQRRRAERCNTQRGFCVTLQKPTGWMSFPSVSSSVASIFSTVQPWARSFCIAAAVTWSFVWLDSMRETNTWKRLTCTDREDNIGNKMNSSKPVYYVDLKKAKTWTHPHEQGPLYRSISLLPCYLQVHHGCFSSHECMLIASSSAEVPSAPM